MTPEDMVASDTARARLDLSLPAADRPQGSVHPVSQVMDELAEIFADLGFAVAEGPEIESDWYNFTALNMPETHPARAMHDTFYVEPREGVDGTFVLRTHTSPVQIRAMQKHGAGRVVLYAYLPNVSWVYAVAFSAAFHM